jgi:hypothetical protein
VEQSLGFRHGVFIGRSALREQALLEEPGQKILDLRLLDTDWPAQVSTGRRSDDAFTS